jgi:hypothetical protein
MTFCLAACSPDPAPPDIATGNFQGNGRDRLCIQRSGNSIRAGLITYGAGDTNCSATGAFVKAGADWVLVPAGESDSGCRIPVAIAGNSAAIGNPPTSCAYYCGPGAEMAGKSFDLGRKADAAADFAGDPLC